jgi:hypothetical protein
MQVDAMSAADDPLSAFFAGELPAVCVRPDGRIHASQAKPRVLLPGSFNPLHAGHLGLARVAAEVLGAPAAFELAVVNADKPPLPAEDVRRRFAQFTWLASVWLTRAPTFHEKALLFPGAVFVVGADTAVRIVEHRFYENSEARLHQALDCVRRQGCRFLVAGRVDAAGRFLGLSDLGLPEAARELFASMPPERFRLDLSSTHLRMAGKT